MEGFRRKVYKDLRKHCGSGNIKLTEFTESGRGKRARDLATDVDSVSEPEVCGCGLRFARSRRMIIVDFRSSSECEREHTGWDRI